MSNVVQLKSVPATPQPATMVLFYSCDAEPKFGVHYCHADSLVETIAKTMFFREPDKEQKAECEALAVSLRETGSVSFEDGWLELRTSITDAVDFMLQKVRDAVGEMEYADSLRFEQLKKAEASDLKYAALRSALNLALGETARRELVSHCQGDGTLESTSDTLS